MFRKALFVAGTAAAAVSLPTAAFADSCANVSRAPAPCGMTCTAGPVIEGNWVWLPSIGEPFPAWGFSPPGSITSIQAGLPDASGNYLQSQGSPSWLLENSAICAGGALARQMAHGIQSGCGA